MSYGRELFRVCPTSKKALEDKHSTARNDIIGAKEMAKASGKACTWGDVGENPYLQFFIGMKEYGPCPFGASTLVELRKRFSEEDMAKLLEASVPIPEKADDEDDHAPPNGGTLLLDAACCPADIAYPQDINLLNQAREKLEQTVDEICKSTCGKKPRMYRQRARRDFLRLSKSKKRSAKAIRSAL